MSLSKKNVIFATVSLIIVGGLGFAIGSATKHKGGPPIDVENEHSNGMAVKQAGNSQYEQKTMDELTLSMGEIMLPEDEFNKLRDAIVQTAMGLLMQQTQGAVDAGQAEPEIRSSVEKKYDRKFFASGDGSSIKDLSREDLIAILTFYSTEPGNKFLKLSPKIREETMSKIQGDLSQWLPSTVQAVAARFKGGNPGEAAPPQGAPMTPPRGQMPPPGNS